MPLLPRPILPQGRGGGRKKSDESDESEKSNEAGASPKLPKNGKALLKPTETGPFKVDQRKTSTDSEAADEDEEDDDEEVEETNTEEEDINQKRKTSNASSENTGGMDQKRKLSNASSSGNNQGNQRKISNASSSGNNEETNKRKVGNASNKEGAGNQTQEAGNEFSQLSSATVKQFLCKNPKFLEQYITNVVDSSTIKEWMSKKGKDQQDDSQFKCSSTSLQAGSKDKVRGGNAAEDECENQPQNYQCGYQPPHCYQPYNHDHCQSSNDGRNQTYARGYNQSDQCGSTGNRRQNAAPNGKNNQSRCSEVCKGPSNPSRRPDDDSDERRNPTANRRQPNSPPDESNQRRNPAASQQQSNSTVDEYKQRQNSTAIKMQSIQRQPPDWSNEPRDSVASQRQSIQENPDESALAFNFSQEQQFQIYQFRDFTASRKESNPTTPDDFEQRRDSTGSRRESIPTTEDFEQQRRDFKGSRRQPNSPPDDSEQQRGDTAIRRQSNPIHDEFDQQQQNLTESRKMLNDKSEVPECGCPEPCPCPEALDGPDKAVCSCPEKCPCPPCPPSQERVQAGKDAAQFCRSVQDPCSSNSKSKRKPKYKTYPLRYGFIYKDENDNKECTGETRNYLPQPQLQQSCRPCCPNKSLLCHFEHGYDYAKYFQEQKEVENFCTCVELPKGSRTQRPYIIFQLDQTDDNGCVCNQVFTVPRPMTESEMNEFTNRYGFDIHRRVKTMPYKY